MVFKEMIIRRQRIGKMPELTLHGQWLEELEFTAGTLVTAVYQDACLTLRSDDPFCRNNAAVLCVKSKIIGGRPRTCLALNGLLLMRYGFYVGDRLGLSLTAGMIQITKINTFTNVKPAI